ncbi:MAG TPA: hypothetical protein VFX59_29690 [Polyangiales bacterium]|nr:hypothetical protein [Polyangiales bacterium]
MIIRPINNTSMSDHDLLHLWQSWVQQGPFGQSKPFGRGNFRSAGPSLRNDYSRVPHKDSPAGRRMMPYELERLRAQEAFEGLITSLIRESHFPEMQRMARRILVADSFGLGVCYGLVSYPAHEVSGLLELGQVFLLADLHDQVCRPLSVSSFVGPKAGAALFVRGLFAFGEAEWLQRRLAKAHATRELIYKELSSIMENPAEFFEGLPGKVQQAYQAKWRGFTQRHQKEDLRSQFEAGKIFGELLMEALVTIASLVAMAGALVKLGAKAPQLVGWARRMRAGGRAAAGEGAGSTSAAASEAAAPPKKSAPPPPEPPQLPPEQREAEFRNLAKDITRETRGQWTAKPVPLLKNGSAYAGEGGEALVFDSEGNMFRGNLDNREQFPITREGIVLDYSKLKPL